MTDNTKCILKTFCIFLKSTHDPLTRSSTFIMTFLMKLKIWHPKRTVPYYGWEFANSSDCISQVQERSCLLFYPWHSPTPYSCCWVGTCSSPVQTGSFERLLQNKARKTCMMKSPPQSISSSLGHLISVFRCFRHIPQGI